MPDTLCWAPWSSVTINNSGEYRPCCIMFNDRNFTKDDGTGFNVNEIGDFERFMSSKTLASIREAMLKGEWHKNCNRCELREKNGVTSQRQDYNSMLADKRTPTGIKLKHLDINFGNKCNLKCRMCYPSMSHLLAKEWPQLGLDDGRPYSKSYETPNKIDVNALKSIIESYSDDIQYIRFGGGEAMVNDEHDELITWLVDENYAKNITLFYNTNGTILTDALLNYWTKFKRVVLSISIDAYGDLNTYIRYPSSWYVIERNMNKLELYAKDTPHVTVSVSTTVQALNVTRIHELISWSKEFKYVRGLPHTKVVTEPKTLDLRVIPKSLRIDASKTLMNEMQTFKMKNHPYFERMQKVANMMAQTDELDGMFEKFLDTNFKFDKVRKTNLLEVLPELIPFIK